MPGVTSNSRPAAHLGQFRRGTLPERPQQLTDEELIAAARRADPRRANEYLDILYRRYYAKVAVWCLKICGDREVARDVAQDVFLRVHTRLDSFRMESRFSTWLYTVTRRVAINGRLADKVRQTVPLDEDPTDPALPADERLDLDRTTLRLRRKMIRRLNGREAEVMILHFVEGLTLKGVTDLLRLDNKSGAKAYVVSAKRKMRHAQAAA